jgi:hypothetical protein
MDIGGAPGGGAGDDSDGPGGLSQDLPTHFSDGSACSVIHRPKGAGRGAAAVFALFLSLALLISSRRFA